MSERFSDDPKISLSKDGSRFHFVSGQPVMDQGVHNAVLISLFTRRGWCGNVFLQPESVIGSDFEKIARGTITLSRLVDLERAAETALASNLFPDVRVSARNPSSDNLAVQIKIGTGGALSLNREGALWQA